MYLSSTEMSQLSTDEDSLDWGKKKNGQVFNVEHYSRGPALSKAPSLLVPWERHGQIVILHKEH